MRLLYNRFNSCAETRYRLYSFESASQICRDNGVKQDKY